MTPERAREIARELYVRSCPHEENSGEDRDATDCFQCVQDAICAATDEALDEALTTLEGLRDHAGYLGDLDLAAGHHRRFRVIKEALYAVRALMSGVKRIANEREKLAKQRGENLVARIVEVEQELIDLKAAAVECGCPPFDGNIVDAVADWFSKLSGEKR